MFSIRSTIPRLSRTIQPRAASLHTSFVAQKSVVDNVKETAADLNMKVGKKLAAGIETGQETAASAKETVAQNIPSAGEVKGKAEEVRQSANQGLGEAASKAREVKDEAAGKAQEVKKDAANTVKDASNEANKKVQQQ